MTSIIRYLQSEGLVRTVQKVFEKIIPKESDTVFLTCRDLPKTIAFRPDISFEKLNNENLKIFEEIKFFRHISGEEILMDANQEVALIKYQGEYVGYAGVQFETRRKIHGLCDFLLREKESWIGPVYIKREFRNKGLNRYALQFIMNSMRKEGFCTFFTAINSSNHSSLKSFMHCGFSEIGHVISRKGRKKIADGAVDFLSRYQA